MKLNKKIGILLCVAMIVAAVASGCTSDDGGTNNDANNGNNGNVNGDNSKDQDEKNEGTGADDKKTQQGSNSVNDPVSGTIMKIDEDGVHVQVGDKIERYHVDSTVAGRHYLGEAVNVSRLDDDTYDLSVNETYDFSNRLTSAGDAIKRVTGTLGDVGDDFMTLVTEMGDVKFANPGDFGLEKGAQAIFDYVEQPDGNQLISYYDEATKLTVTVKEIARDDAGMMRIFATGADNREYDIHVLPQAVTNFAHSSLKAEENITVYPDKVTGDVPQVVDAKMILRDTDK